MTAPAAWATALAASLPEAVSTALSASSNVISSPARSPALDSPTPAASGVTVTGASASRCSEATMAVMIFVSEAIWARSPAARPNHRVPSSSMSAAWEASMLGRRSSGSPSSAAPRSSTESPSSVHASAEAGRQQIASAVERAHASAWGKRKRRSLMTGLLSGAEDATLAIVRLYNTIGSGAVASTHGILNASWMHVGRSKGEGTR